MEESYLYNYYPYSPNKNYETLVHILAISI